MKSRTPQGLIFTDKNTFRSLISLQWLILLSVVILNFSLHWRTGQIIQILEMSWAAIVLFLTAFILSSRLRWAIRLVYYMTSAFMLVYLGACITADGIDGKALCAIIYVVAVLVAATRQFLRDGVLFGATR